MSGITWDKSFETVGGFERGARVALFGGTLAGLLDGRLASNFQALRNFTFALWIADDVRRITQKRMFQGEKLELARDGAQLSMDLILSIAFFAPQFEQRFSWMAPAGDIAWVSTNLFNVYLKDKPKDRRVAIADAIFAVASTTQMRLFFFNRPIPCVELSGLVSGGVALYTPPDSQ